MKVTHFIIMATSKDQEIYVTQLKNKEQSLKLTKDLRKATKFIYDESINIKELESDINKYIDAIINNLNDDPNDIVIENGTVNYGSLMNIAFGITMLFSDDYFWGDIKAHVLPVIVPTATV